MTHPDETGDRSDSQAAGPGSPRRDHPSRFLHGYTREHLIALAHERGIYPLENAADEELKVVERRLSAERGWICRPQPKENLRQGWINCHRDLGHNPYAAPTHENPERWECKCDPDAVWTAVWRILTPEQVRQKFAHLKRTRPGDLSDD